MIRLTSSAGSYSLGSGGIFCRSPLALPHSMPAASPLTEKNPPRLSGGFPLAVRHGRHVCHHPVASLIFDPLLSNNAPLTAERLPTVSLFCVAPFEIGTVECFGSTPSHKRRINGGFQQLLKMAEGLSLAICPRETPLRRAQLDLTSTFFPARQESRINFLIACCEPNAEAHRPISAEPRCRRYSQPHHDAKNPKATIRHVCPICLCARFLI